MRRSEFERLVEMAVLAVPERFRCQLHNVAFVVEARPRSGLFADGDDGCLGLYEGVPLIERDGDPDGFPPDKITLFQEMIEADAEDEAEIPLVVRETVWHEIAHYFGFDEDRAETLERRWEDRWQELYPDRK